MSNDGYQNKRYLKTANLLRFLRYLVFISLVLLIVGSIAFFREDITVENMRYLMRYIDVQAPTISDSRKQVRFFADGEARYALLRGNIAVVSGQSINLYDFSGRKLLDFELKYTSPAIKTGKKYALVYDLAGKGLSIFNTYSCVFSEEFPYGIRDACILDRGEFAVATSEKNYRSGIVVHNKDFKEIFRWMSRDKYVTSVSLSEDASRAVCAVSGARDGAFESELLVFDVGAGTQIHALPLDGELPFVVSYTKDGFMAITDLALRFYRRDGELYRAIPYGAKGLSSCCFGDTYFIAAYETAEIGGGMDVSVYDYTGALLHEESPSGKILDIHASGGKIYVLEAGKLNIYEYRERKGEFIPGSSDSFPVDGEFARVFAADSNEYILVSAKGAGKYVLAGQ